MHNEDLGFDTSVLDAFDTISLEEMKRVKLMNRTDTKFVTTTGALFHLLRLAADRYYVQQIGGQVAMPYYTRYYDTADYEMYHHHQRGKLTRKKIRVRRYVGSGLEFLEVKRKNNKGRTDKRRIKSGSELPDEQRRSFIVEMSGYTDSELVPQIENNFTRLTLVNKDMTERLTIDTGLSFHNLVSGTDRRLDGLVIIELKRDGRVPSPISSLLRQLRIKESGFSKYCMGMALTNPEVPVHRFKERLRHIEKMISREMAERHKN